VSRYEKEKAALALLGSLFSEAEKCKQAFVEAGLPLPGPLARFLDEEDDRGSAVSPNGHARALVPRPPPPSPSPPDMTEDWIWVDIGDMSADHMTLGILRAASGPMSPGAIAEAASMMGRETSRGTIGNVGTKFFGKSVEQTTKGWCLMPGASAPVLLGKYAWGPPDIFNAAELASHRRGGIVHLLHVRSDGLQIVQIAHALEADCPWNRAPVNADLVKADMQILDKDGRAKRVGGASGKWRAALM
jgi:hypothetical protein